MHACREAEKATHRTIEGQAVGEPDENLRTGNDKPEIEASFHCTDISPKQGPLYWNSQKQAAPLYLACRVGWSYQCSPTTGVFECSGDWNGGRMTRKNDVAGPLLDGGLHVALFW
jgi:hypothetical protein